MDKAKHLLYIEDDSIDQLALKRILQKDSRITYSVVNRMEDAKELLRQGVIDLIITDYYLSDGSAMEVLSLAKGIPCIVVSGTVQPEEKEAIKDLGAIYYLGKPLVPSTFLPLLQECLFGTAPCPKRGVEIAPPIDFQHIKNLSKMSPEGEIKLIQAFLLDFPDLLAQLEKGLEEKEYESVGEILEFLTPKLDLIGLGARKAQALSLAQNFQAGENQIHDNEELLGFIEQIIQAVKAASQIIPQM